VLLSSWLSSNKWGNWRKEDKWLWRLSKKHGSNGALGDTGVHIFDFAINAVGDIKEIFTDIKTYHDKGKQIGDYILDANDGFNSLVRYENGAIGTITNTRYATGHANSIILEVFCTKGALKVELDEARSKWSTLNICQNDNINKILWETIECPKTPNNYENFIKSIKSNIQIQPDFNQGAKIQKIIDSCIKSNDNNIWVDINY
jgi:Predicted dehydrogenases and related proteins